MVKIIHCIGQILTYTDILTDYGILTDGDAETDSDFTSTFISQI
jgi:hypothetical protein